jgi:hypothetical protein
MRATQSVDSNDFCEFKSHRDSSRRVSARLSRVARVSASRASDMSVEDLRARFGLPRGASSAALERALRQMRDGDDDRATTTATTPANARSRSATPRPRRDDRT